MPFNRIIFGHGWPDAPQGGVDYPSDRGPRHDDYIVNGGADFIKLASLPTLFMSEGQSSDDFARIGFVHVMGQGPSTLSLRYQYDLSVPAVSQDRLHFIAAEIGLTTHGRQFDWTRTQWTVEDGDLYRAFFRLAAIGANIPRVFSFNSPPRIDSRQVSVMMPFDADFGPLYSTIEAAAVEVNMRCSRADNIWEHHTVIQDVVSLIDRSSVVVCDLSGRNPNVFYEAGIAHALGREVILITRQPDDVPFDLQHLRYIHYLNNDQGLARLRGQLVDRFRALPNLT